MTGIEKVAKQIICDLKERFPSQRKTQRDKLGLLVATMLEVRSANLMDLASVLPRPIERIEKRYQWIERFVSNDLVDCDTVMAPFAREVLDRISASGERPVLLIDQSQVSSRHQVLMAAVRLGGRALPLCWRVRETKGAIGFSVQHDVLEAVRTMLPEGAVPVLMGDRFYGSPDLIALCRAWGWGYRLRLKDTLLVFDAGGGETTLADCVARGETALTGVAVTEKAVPTNVAIVHEEAHPEPWIIAMDEKPGKYRALDYGLRWGIEAMFSDFKTRGFGLEDTQLQYPDRVERLILVMAVALYWAVSTGMWDARANPSTAEKKTPKPDRKRSPDPSHPSSNAASEPSSDVSTATKNCPAYGKYG